VSPVEIDEHGQRVTGPPHGLPVAATMNSRIDWQPGSPQLVPPPHTELSTLTTSATGETAKSDASQSPGRRTSPASSGDNSLLALLGSTEVAEGAGGARGNDTLFPSTAGVEKFWGALPVQTRTDEAGPPFQRVDALDCRTTQRRTAICERR